MRGFPLSTKTFRFNSRPSRRPGAKLSGRRSKAAPPQRAARNCAPSSTSSARAMLSQSRALTAWPVQLETFKTLSASLRPRARPSRQLNSRSIPRPQPEKHSSTCLASSPSSRRTSGGSGNLRELPPPRREGSIKVGRPQLMRMRSNASAPRALVRQRSPSASGSGERAFIGSPTDSSPRLADEAQREEPKELAHPPPELPPPPHLLS